jgi:hypothetical protein
MSIHGSWEPLIFAQQSDGEARGGVQSDSPGQAPGLSVTGPRGPASLQLGGTAVRLATDMPTFMKKSYTPSSINGLLSPVR